MNKYVILAFITVLLISGGQVLLKYSTKTLDFSMYSLNYHGLLKVISNQHLILALGVYAISSVLWIRVLSKLDLSFAYLMISLSFPIVLILSSIFFKETISNSKIIGVFLIVIANVIIFLGNKV